MAAVDGDESSKPSKQRQKKQENGVKLHHRSIFDVRQEFFASCRVVPSPVLALSDQDIASDGAIEELESRKEVLEPPTYDGDVKAMQRWACNTCKAEFESLQEQRLHFKSDLHRFNIKLRIAGKSIIKEEDFDESISDSLCKDYDVSSISGSEDEEEREARFPGNKNKIYIQLQEGEIVSVWRCLLLNESETVQFGDKCSAALDGSEVLILTPRQVLEKLSYVVSEPRDRTCLRIVLLAKGGHFAGCVFDGDTLVTHKTFHRYVVRAKAGKKQSSKDAGGRAIHSAGASLRRYNELSLKKEIRELLASWAPYFAVASCVFLHSPSTNRQLLFDGEKPYFDCHHHAIRPIPLPVRRPTLKEAKRLYNLLVQISPEVIAKMESEKSTKQEELPRETELSQHLEAPKVTDVSSISTDINGLSLSVVTDELETVCMSTQLHEAAKSGNAQKVLELLEQGLDPCIKDERGQTPYMLASEKEVRNTFRRFMASNLEKWDWHAAKVPSALTKEMEESQAVKQAEKDAKRKAKAKELKKLKKAKEKSQRAEAASKSDNHDGHVSSFKGSSQTSSSSTTSKEVEPKRSQDAEREKRAAAAERRIAEAAAALKTQPVKLPGSLEASDMTICSLCSASLAGKVPFHRYSYKYCSPSCMHSHREILEQDP